MEGNENIKKARVAATRADDLISTVLSGPVRVIQTPVETPLYHPLSKRDIQRVLSVLPAESTAGLRSVSLLGDMLTTGGNQVMSTYRRPGFIRMHAVSRLTWHAGILHPGMISELRRFGAQVIETERETAITWSPDELRLFFTVEVLLPSIARHRREMEGHGEPGMMTRSLESDPSVFPISDMAMREWAAFLARG
jgi:hypothetical protein